ncbi:Olfactory receptor 2T2 [Heterocephalus glaber]|uniref:Olfactory receptor 2T2 n=1 Tax=Heterocephalus glaber TaxID=10181 RepID=G5BCR9_HETGA|nr:Olfactory receptor 2T2 [Heterocephalus glaber]
MEAASQNSTDFILLDLIVHLTLLGLIFTVVFSIFVVIVVANVVMVLLIHVDPCLHTPMYFLLNQLSLMDTIFLYVTLIGAEFFLLGLMAYDCYVAVCSPLSYPVIMNHRVCLCMALGSWLGGSLDSFMLTPITMSFPYCASRHINHFFCEIPAMLRLYCLDTSLYETLMAVFYTNVMPHSYHKPKQDKAVSTFYTILTPMINPLIYSLRNRDMAAE